MTNRLIRSIGRHATLLLLVLILAPAVAYAQDEVSLEMFTVNNTWMLVATFLVFIMHLGFASLESGLTRAKNTVNILFKNIGIGKSTQSLMMMVTPRIIIQEEEELAQTGLDSSQL